jgi:hypothetical protein
MGTYQYGANQSFSLSFHCTAVIFLKRLQLGIDETRRRAREALTEREKESRLSLILQTRLLVLP